MTKELLKARAIGFAYEAGTLLLLAVVGALASEEMRGLITQYAGSGLAGTAGLLILTGLVKHLRNLKVLKNRELGAEGSDKPIVLI